jgi:hypothetical protein
MAAAVVRPGHFHRRPGVEDDDGVGIGGGDAGDQFILLPRQAHILPVEAFALPFAGQPGDDNGDVGLGGQVDGRRNRIIRHGRHTAQPQDAPAAVGVGDIFHLESTGLAAVNGTKTAVCLSALFRPMINYQFPIDHSRDRPMPHRWN